MPKKLITLVLVLAFCLTGATEAAKIVVVSDCKVPGVDPSGIHEDDELVQFLESLGHEVDTDGMAQEGVSNGNYREGGRSPWAAGNESKLQHLQDADLIIVSRRTSSGSYDDDRSNWNTLETPLLLMSGYLTRGGGDNRWHWTAGGSGNASNTVTDIVIEPGQEEHPFLLDLTGPIAAFDWSTAPTAGQTPKGVYLPNDDFVAGTTLIGRFDGRPMLADIPAGTVFANGDVAGERRAFLGHWGYDIDLDAPFNRAANFDDFITDDFKILLTNIINEMLGIAPTTARNPKPADMATVDLAEATPLSWEPGENAARHDVYLGTNFNDVNDADASDTSGIYQGRQNFLIYTPAEALELGQIYYWRIDEVEADNTTIHTGKIWSFTVNDYLLIDDFEDYDAGDNQIWYAWRDGLGYGEEGIPPYYPGNNTGSEVGDGSTDSYTEETIVHSGSQSMPYWYNNNKPDKAKYSEAAKTLTDTRDWTQQGVKALSLWFRGYPAYMGGFTEGPAGTYTMTAAGADIWSTSDQFHFAFKEYSGAGTIIAKVVSVSDTHEWTKAGVMIRDTLDADSANAALLITPEHGIRFQRRDTAGDDSVRDFNDIITAPQWVKLERTLGGLIKASYSADGIDWKPFESVPTVTMNLPIYIGLAVTSHDVDAQAVAEFSNVSFPDTNVGAGWSHQDIGITSNEAEPMYVAIANNTGAPAVVYHEDPNATLIDTWTEWNIDLKDFSDKGVSLTDVNSIAIGFGDRDNPQAGGSGKMYFDDIRLYQPRYVPDKVTPLVADFTDDGLVDYRDLEIMANDWLQGDYTVYPETPEPAIAWWKLDNNADDSAGGNHGTLRGNPTFVAGKFGQAINLDGDDYVDLGNPNQLDFGTGNWSICAWVTTTMTGTGDSNKGVIYAKGGDRSGGIRYGLYVNEDQTIQGSIDLVTDDDANKRQAISSVSVSDGEWHHIVGQRDGDTTRVYIDGVLDGTANLPAGYDLSGTSQHNAYIGVVTDNTDGSLEKFLRGSIDDVRIYDYALSPVEIMSIMGLSEMYYPITSPANISDEEPINSKKVNLRDFALLADEWLEERLWPEW